MTNRIEKLALKNFRGATQPLMLEFDAQRSIIMVFGENGAGKSTLVDALDFVCNSEFGSLRDRSSTQPRTHIVSQDAGPKDLSIVLTMNGVEWKGHLSSGKPKTIGPLDQLPPPVRILRRADITRVIEATPGDRYKAIKEFINFPNIEHTEDSLREAYKAAKKEWDTAIASYEQAREGLEKLWTTEGEPSGDVLTWAQTQSAQEVSLLQAQVQTLNAQLSKIESAIRARQRWGDAEVDFRTRTTALESAQQALANAEQGHLQGGALVGLLEQTQTYLAANTATTECPVCGKPETAANLLSRVTAQLGELKNLVALRAVRDNADRAIEQSRGALTTATTEFLRESQALAALVEPLGLVPTALADVLKTSTDDTATMTSANELLIVLGPYQTQWKQQSDDDQKAISLHNAISLHWKTIQEKKIIMTFGDRLVKRLEAMLNIVASQRKQQVEAILAAIAADADTFFEKMHPQESLGGLKLALNPKTAGSLEMTSKFGSQVEVPPGAYYSEAHLDTLGIAVYLALARYAEGSSTIIVLDDVLTSVDDAHLERIIALLHEEAANFGQVILTTHLRTWRDRYRLGRAAANQVQLIELHPDWTAQRGIQTSRPQLFTDELRTYLAQMPMDRQAVASKAGVVLENLLDWLTLKFACRLPRHAEPHYALGDLLGGIDKSLKKLLRVECLDDTGAVAVSEPLQALVDELAGLTWVRNRVGAHFNLDGLSLSNAEIHQFASTTLKLADLLICPHCGALPEKNKSGSYWECGNNCGKTRLYPLVPPA